MARFSLLLLVGIAGAAGALSRYLLGTLIQRAAPASATFPFGTFVVNVLGCFLFGLAWALADQRGMLSPDARFVILTGFMGAFTTFSTFIFDSNTLLQSQQMPLAIVNIAGQVVIGLLCLLAGIALGRAF